MKQKLFFRMLAFLLVPMPAWAATFTVTSVADIGFGSLREAIIDANNSPGFDTIEFDFGGGWVSIYLLTPLPAVTDPVLIDGWSGLPAAGPPQIELDGSFLAMTMQPGNGLTITAGNSIVRGLVVVGFPSNGIELNEGGTNLIVGNYIGPNLGAFFGSPNQGNGIFIVNSASNVIGGAEARLGNVVSGNAAHGIFIANWDSRKQGAGNHVLGNLIGTDETGTRRNGNANDGVQIFFSDGNFIGGPTAAERNIISGNAGWGIQIFNHYTIGRWPFSMSNVVQGNFIGPDINGQDRDLGNGSGGILLEYGARYNLIGSTDATQPPGNVIAFNLGHGIRANGDYCVGNAFLGNRIFFNELLGISLGPNYYSPTPNDANFDADAGPNNLQNYPLLFNAAVSGGGTDVKGGFLSAADTTYRLEFFLNTSCDLSGYGEGQTGPYVFYVHTLANGHASINVHLPVVAHGSYLTATATDPDNNTSEFSACIRVPDQLYLRWDPHPKKFVLKWPFREGEFILESTPDVSMGPWLPVSTQPVLIGDTYYSTNEFNPSQNEFFRLRQAR